MEVKIMDDNEVIDNELVDKFDAEDTIFNNCINDFSEFPYTLQVMMILPDHI